MNNSNGFSTPQLQHHFPSHINPAMLAQSQSQNSNPFPQNAGFNPQMFQQSSPSQLMGIGMGGMGMNSRTQQSLNTPMHMQQQGGQGSMGINPASLSMNMGGNIGGSMGMGIGAGGGGGMNAGNMSMGASGGMSMGGGGGGGMNFNAMGLTPQQLAHLQSLTPQQLQQLAHAKLAQQQQQERAFGQNQQNQSFNPNQQFMGGNALQQPQRREQGLQNILAQQQAQVSTGAYFDQGRPSSTSSAHSFHSQPQQLHHSNSIPNLAQNFNAALMHGQNNSMPFPQQQQSMMPPPPPRPPSVRPSTSHSQRSASAAGHHPQSPSLSNTGMGMGMGGSGGLSMGIQRPPSRQHPSAGGFAPSPGPHPGAAPSTPNGTAFPMSGGVKPPTPIQPVQGVLQRQPSQPPQPQRSPFQPMMPGSPRRRKSTGGSVGSGDFPLGNASMGLGGAPGMGGMAPLPMNVGVGQGGLMPSGGNNANMLGGSGGRLMGPPHVVPSRGPSQTPAPDVSMGMGGMTAGGDARMRPSPGQTMNMGMYEQSLSPVQPKLNPVTAMAALRERDMHMQGMGGLGGVAGTADAMAMPGVGSGMSLDVGMAGVDGPASAPPSATVPRIPNTVIPPPLPAPISAPVPPVVPPASTSTSGSVPAPVKRANSGNTDLKEATTRITYVGPDDIAPLSEQEMTNVNTWMARDKAYDALFRDMRGRMDQERAAIGPKSAGWWEEADPTRPRTRFSITYPGSRLKENRKKGRREGFKLPRIAKDEQPEDPEVLVPIRLEFDVDHNKMRDTFVWNLNDSVVTPETFAQSIVDDYALAPSYVNVIAKAIQDQLIDYKAHSMDDIQEGTVRGKLEGAEELWWEGWRKRLWVDGSRRRKRRRVAIESDAETDKSMMPVSVGDIEVNDDGAQEEMRILIKLDITVGSMKLDDQFEWDIENPGASPEQFAEVYARDLGLGGEFKTAIAHCIREQVQTYQKSLFLVGHPSDGTMVQDDDLRMSFLPSLSSAARSMDQVQSFTPILNYLSDSELERNEKEREKELARRKKRNTRGRRGVALPDREPAKTCRTPAIGFPEADPAVLALAQAAAAPAGRRAAAAAASVTIANMVASENGTALITPSAPAAAPSAAAAPKEKKPKGLFKAPPVPPSVLHARARVRAPTGSTAVDASTLPPPLENDPPLPMAVTPPDSRAMRTISAKRAKELEREAKEKEFVDGQHANMINGVWHCSNCGCPEDIAIGRRKGPLGDKSQCGTCGKFWHRHRRPRPVEYNSDPQFHLKQRADAEKSKSSSKRKRGGQTVDEASTPAPIPGPETPSKRSEMETTKAPASRRTGGEERAISPVSSSSSASEPPLAQRIKLNGANTSRATSAVPPLPPSEEPPSNGNGVDSTSALYMEDGQGTDDLPPDWLVEGTAAAQQEFPDDRFEIIARNGPTGLREWRMKCLDCPGKMYKPNKTGELGLSNFGVHLQNRLHRNKVNARIAADGGTPVTTLT